jgi:hypothetical protein
LQLLAACFPNGLSAVKVKQKVENNLWSLLLSVNETQFSQLGFRGIGKRTPVGKWYHVIVSYITFIYFLIKVGNLQLVFISLK